VALAEEMLPATLVAAPPVAAIVADKIFPTGARKGVACPYVTFQRAGTTQSGHLTGGGNLDQVRMQTNCWASTALGALELAGVVRDAIEPVDGVSIGTFQNQLDPSLDEETRQWGVITDYFIWQERN
jgi:hypothetical protein